MTIFYAPENNNSTFYTEHAGEESIYATQQFINSVPAQLAGRWGQIK
jgi:hypothetical protein